MSTLISTPSTGSVSKSLCLQCRVIGALLLREVITRYGRHNIGMLWLIAEPMLFTLGITVLWTVAKLHTVSDIPIVAFAVTGYSSVLVWRNAANRCTHAITVNAGLLYHPNVRVIDILSARVLLELVGGTASLAVLTMGFCFAGLMEWPRDMARALAAWLLLCWFAWSLGLVVGVLAERYDFFERLWHVATYLLFPLSGAVYMVDWLPAAAQRAVLWLPMVHGTEMIRQGFFGDRVTTHESPAYLAIFNLVLTLIALTLVRQAGKWVKPE